MAEQEKAKTAKAASGKGFSIAVSADLYRAIVRAAAQESLHSGVPVSLNSIGRKALAEYVQRTPDLDRPATAES